MPLAVVPLFVCFFRSFFVCLCVAVVVALDAFRRTRWSRRSNRWTEAEAPQE